MIDSTLVVFYYALGVGLVSLAVGYIARSLKVALGCAFLLFLIAAGISSGLFFYRLFYDWQMFKLARLQP